MAPPRPYGGCHGAGDGPFTTVHSAQGLWWRSRERRQGTRRTAAFGHRCPCLRGRGRQLCLRSPGRRVEAATVGYMAAGAPSRSARHFAEPPFPGRVLVQEPEAHDNTSMKFLLGMVLLWKEKEEEEVRKREEEEELKRIRNIPLNQLSPLQQQKLVCWMEKEKEKEKEKAKAAVGVLPSTSSSSSVGRGRRRGGKGRGAVVDPLLRPLVSGSHFRCWSCLRCTVLRFLVRQWIHVPDQSTVAFVSISLFLHVVTRILRSILVLFSVFAAKSTGKLDFLVLLVMTHFTPCSFLLFSGPDALHHGRYCS